MLERSQLNTIRVASPCTASWDAMKGDDQVRYCGQCKLNVYNLSEMSLDEISQLMARKEGRTCVRFYRRADGTVLTDDCPVGLRAIRRRLALVAAAGAALLTGAVGSLAFARGAMARTLRSTRLAQIPIVRTLADWMEPARVEVQEPMMGKPMMLYPPRAIQGRVAAPPVGCNGAAPSTPAVKPQAGMGEAAFEMGDMVVPEPVKPQPANPAPQSLDIDL